MANPIEIDRQDPGPRASLLDHCYIAMRNGDGPLFWATTEDGIGFALNGYAIVPLEDYAAHAAPVQACWERDAEAIAALAKQEGGQ